MSSMMPLGIRLHLLHSSKPCSAPCGLLCCVKAEARASKVLPAHVCKLIELQLHTKQRNTNQDGDCLSWCGEDANIVAYAGMFWRTLRRHASCDVQSSTGPCTVALLVSTRYSSCSAPLSCCSRQRLLLSVAVDDQPRLLLIHKHCCHSFLLHAHLV
jgi:hypothetical protein